MTDKATRPKNGTSDQIEKSDRAEIEAQTQRGRKRAWDRAAQRTLRQKTKGRIEHLEKTVHALEQERQGSVVPGLMGEIEALRVENERLKKVIGDSISFLQAAHGSAVGDVDVEPARHVPANVPTTSVSSEDGLTASPENDNQMALTIPCVGMSPQFDDYSSAFRSLGEIDSFNVNCSQEASTSVGRSCPPNSCAFETLATLGSPLYTSPSIYMSGLGLGNPNCTANFGGSSVTNFLANVPSRCTAWHTANQIFKGISHVDAIEALAADAIDVGPLLQGIHLGWDSEVSAENLSPSTRILQQMDQSIWVTMSKLNRAAIACKSHMLIRYFLNPSAQNLSSMPAWERPMPLQMCIDHPVAVDFFPWPALREHLILNQELYLNSCDFFSGIISDFRFNWPYRFEDSFVVEVTTGAYRASPLFIQYVRSLDNWTMASPFFKVFPHLREHIRCVTD